jgi:hypothetical protein
MLYQHAALSGQHSPTERVATARVFSSVGESLADKRSESFANLRLLGSGGRRKKQHHEKLILAELKGQSSIMVTARFGRWTLLRENTIQIDTKIAEVDCQLDRLLRLIQPHAGGDSPARTTTRDFRVKEPSDAFLVSTPILSWIGREDIPTDSTHP